MLRIIKGNIFTSDCQTLVNTVNCVGVMGAGVALEFKLRYPEMFGLYVEHCRSGELGIGKPWLYKPKEREKKWILNFPTKKDWKHPSKETYLHQGLKSFVETYESQGIESIAFPILGAQNGRIPESDSVGIMASYLYKCDIDIEIYRYDPDAKDDLYEEFKQQFESRIDQEIASETGLRLNHISVLRQALRRPDIKTISQLASQRGIGGKTLEKVFTRLTSSPPRQPELFSTRPQALDPPASQRV